MDMTSESSLERRHADGWFSWAHDPRALMKAGLPLVVVAIAILWVVWNKRPEPPPASLAELDRVAGEVQSVVEDYRPLYRTKVGRKAVVHQRDQRGWVLTLKPGGDDSIYWIQGDDPALAAQLPVGTRVIAHQRDGQIFQLETPRGVVLDLEASTASQRTESLTALAIVALLLAAGVWLCGRAIALSARAER
jgi:hypothetical protein